MRFHASETMQGGHKPPAARRCRPPGSAWSLAALAAVTLLAACGSRDDRAASAHDRLAPLPVAVDSVTVSGLSAGGYMAVQFHVAHSSLVSGAGIFAGGPYYCAENSLRYALGQCMQGQEPIATDELISLTSRLALDGIVDPIAGLAGDRVWIFHGGADPVVARPVADALEAYYQALVDPRAVKRVEIAAAGNIFPGNSSELAACGATEEPFVGNCGLDGARQMLEYLYGRFSPGTTAPEAGELRQFKQSPYADAMRAPGLAATGYVYVPAACAGDGAPGRCRLHVYFHGCKQGASYVKDAFIRRSGFLAAADAGNVVVLFPQVEPSYQPLNPNGCWDWWGYTGEAYATQQGPQVMAVKLMVDDLLGAGTPAQ
jgi:poly(3-hydroxybutyrate) depolymerase